MTADRPGTVGTSNPPDTADADAPVPSSRRRLHAPAPPKTRGGPGRPWSGTRRAGVVTALVLLLGVAATPALADPSIPTAIPVGSSPRGIAAEPLTQEVYVTNQGDDSVSVIDTRTDTVTATIPVGASPERVAINSVIGRAYVTNLDGNSVSVIDTLSKTVTDTITFEAPGIRPFAVAANPTNGRVYVTDLRDGSITTIDGYSNTVISTVTGIGETSVAVNPVTNWLYVTAYNSMLVLDDSTYHLIHYFPVGAQADAVAVDPVTLTVYAANSGDATVSVVDGLNGGVTATIPVGVRPVAVAVDPPAGHVYVVNQEDASVSVIDTHSNTVVSTVDVGAGPTGVDVDLTNGQVYVTNSDDGNVSTFPGRAD